jgi:effector-binding domain-containing protein
VIEKPHVTEVAAQQTAVIRLSVPIEQIQEVMGAGLHELMSTLAAQGVAPAGPWLTHHFRKPAETFDFEIAVAVTRPVAAAGRVQTGSLPGGRVARATYRGPYEGLGQAWGEFEKWIADQGLSPAGEELWECYAAGPEAAADPKEYRTEFYRPLA